MGSMARATKVTSARFMLECDIDPHSDDNQYLVLAQDEEREKEEDDEVISYWSEDHGDWFFDEASSDFPNEGELLCDITEVICV
nr:hypothetical protein CFP56_35630 [Quercus suber]